LKIVKSADIQLQPILAGLSPNQLGPLIACFVPGMPLAGRTVAIESALKAPGSDLRRNIGDWIAGIVPVEVLIPDRFRHWRPLVRDAIQFVFSNLSDHRLAAKLAEQIGLPPETPAEARLLTLIGKMPGLQKLGQVLARDRRLARSLRTALSELENGMRDVTWGQIRGIITRQLGRRLKKYDVEVEPRILAEASVSAVVRFTWRSPGRENERGVFKVLKPYVPDCFSEDMTLLQNLGEFLTSREGGYKFSTRDARETLADVRLLLEHELDFTREQATLLDAYRLYRSNLFIRIPRLIQPLCTPVITAMSEESGVKVTDALRSWPLRRRRIADQLIEALLAVPLFAPQDNAIFHGDPHAGNLMYDEPNRELIVLDWALAARLSLEERRHLLILALMMMLRNKPGVLREILAISHHDSRPRRAREQLIRRKVDVFFTRLSPDREPGALDAMRLLDQIAIEGIRLPPALFVVRKTLFMLDGVLRDVAGTDVPMDRVIGREYLTRWIASLGTFRAPLKARDIATLEWNALVSIARKWSRRILAFPGILSRSERASASMKTTGRLSAQRKIAAPASRA
jgi:ubiquinone biosynthesis protein